MNDRSERSRGRAFAVALGLVAALIAGSLWRGCGSATAPPVGEPPPAAGPGMPAPGPAAVAAAPPERHDAPAAPAAPPNDPSAPPRRDDDGRTSALVGRVARGDRGLADVTVELVAGLDRTTATRTDADGRYRLEPLHPDAAAVAFRRDGVVLARRDVVVRHDATTTLDLDATPPPETIGTVLGPDRRPLPGAVVECDGQRTWTDASGQFVLRREARGPARVVVGSDGMATRDLAVWTGGTRTIVLPRGATLDVAVPPRTDGSDVWLYVLPNPTATSIHANLRAPLRARAGDVTRLTGLPSADVTVRAFHPFAVAGPATAQLRPGTATTVTPGWRDLPLLHGSVRAADGRPVAGAAVHLRARDQHEAVFVALGDARPWLRQCAAEPLPAADRIVTSGADGGFRFGVPELQHGTLELTATLGTRSVRRRLAADASRVELVLPD